MRRFPRFTLLLATPWFGLHIGYFARLDGYGMCVSWGYDNDASGPIGWTHKHIRTWVWLTAEQVFDRD